MRILRNFRIVPPVPSCAIKIFNVDMQIHNPQSISFLTMYGTISYPLRGSYLLFEMTEDENC